MKIFKHYLAYFKLLPLKMKLLKLSKKQLSIVVVFVSLVSLIVVSSYRGDTRKHTNESNSEANEKFAIALEDSFMSNFKNDTLALNKAVFYFYKNREFKPVWTKYNMLADEAVVMLKLLNTAQNYGLLPEFYEVDALNAYVESLTLAKDEGTFSKVYNFETLLTKNALLFMAHLKSGILHTDSMFVENNEDSWHVIYTQLEKSLKNEFRTNILAIQPTNTEYVNLQAGLENFMVSHKLTNDTIFLVDYKTDSITCIQQIQKILIENNWSDESSQDQKFFSGNLKKFQRQHGLEEDGRLGRNTVKALKMNIYDHFKVAAVNLERLRSDKPLPETCVAVNIPGYTLNLFKNNKSVKTYRVIVGHPQTPTPLIVSKMQQIVVYPEWYVPISITTKEIVPKIRKDSSYIEHMNFQVFDRYNNPVAPNEMDHQQLLTYNFRQKSGATNSLGIIKFIFPNEHSVYFHDTPYKGLFNSDLRAFSHGCVRVENPVDLAQSIFGLQNDENSAKLIAQTISTKSKHFFNLQNRLDVVIKYNTCVTDSLNNIIFYSDIYGLDEAISKKMGI